MACGHLVPHAVSPLRWYHPPWPRLVCLTMFVQHSDKRRRVRLKWLLKLSALKSSEFRLIACTYSERRICFLREVGFPFVMTGKTPQVSWPLRVFFLSPGILHFIYCYYYLFSNKLWVSDLWRKGLMKKLDWISRKDGVQRHRVSVVETEIKAHDESGSPLDSGLGFLHLGPLLFSSRSSLMPLFNHRWAIVGAQPPIFRR